MDMQGGVGDAGGADRPVARNCTVDAVVAVLLMVVGLVVVFEARRLGAGWESDGPGAGYFPFYIGLLLCIGGAGILYQAVLSKARDTDTFVDRAQLKRVAQVFVPSVVYALGIMALGLYLASAIFIALFMVVLGRYSVLKSVTVGVLVNALFFMMFEVWFKVPLYKGLLNPLGFLGY